MRFFSINPPSLGRLGSISQQIRSTQGNDAQIKVAFLRPYGVAYLDQVLMNIESNGRCTLHSTYPALNQYLKQCQFKYLTLGACCEDNFPQQDIIAIQRFIGSVSSVEQEVVAWLKSCVHPFMPKLSTKLWKKIVESLWEIVHNGIWHGEGEFGVSACGQFYPLMGYFEIAFHDLGHGIPTVVKKFRALPTSASDEDCITWAIQKGHSTRPLTESAGLGLHLLREFLTINRGTFQIASGNGYFGKIGDEESSVLPLRNSIEGTLVNIRIVYDDHLYTLKSKE